MNETYVIQEDTMQTVPDETDKTKTPKSKRCGSKCTAVLCCLLTFGIIFGFGFLFGPLILQDNRLYNFSPSHFAMKYYRLRLEPTGMNDFQGRASILFRVAERTKEIRLLAEDLHIKQMNLTLRHQVHLAHDVHLHNLPSLKHSNETGKSYHVGKVTNITIGKVSKLIREDRVGVLILFEKPLRLGEYMLDILYHGNYSPGGLERVVYEDVSGARRRGDQAGEKTEQKEFFIMNSPSKVLPHFDLKTKVQFEVSVARSTHMQCFSNVAFKEIEIVKTLDGLIWEHFKPTPAMLPSSLSLIIADYKNLNVHSKSSTILKIRSPEKYVKQLNYAAKTFAKVFDYFEGYFEASFPLSKLDVVLLPYSKGDSSSSPLSASKLGVITLSAEDLLLSESSEAMGRQRRIFQAIGEVVAIQFLQLLTDISENEALIEGFAKYVAYVAEKELNDQTLWKSEESFVENVLEASLNDMGQDKVIKMASVQRMINDTVKSHLFKSAWNQLLSSDSMDNFLGVLEQLKLSEGVSGKDLLQSWWKNPGYPIVTVMRTTGWNVLISQDNLSEGGDVFTIPLNFIAGDRPDLVKSENLTLNRRQIITNLFVPQEHWLLFNYNRCGYYRVNYDLPNWRQLIKQLTLQPSKIPVINRAALIDDAFALADEGLLRVDVPFGAVNYLRSGNERNYMPWRAGLSALNRHEGVFLDSADYGVFRKYKVSLLSTLWSKRHLLAADLSSLIFAELCNLQYKPCVDQALKMYDLNKYRKDVEVSQEICCTAMAHSPRDEFEFRYGKLKRSWNYEEVKCLTCSKDASNIYKLLNETFANINYARHIWSSMKASSMSRLTGLQFLENFLTKHYNFEGERVTEIWGIVIDEFLSTLSTDVNLIKVKKMSLYFPQSLQEKVQRAVEKITKEIHWAEQYLMSFKEELLKYP